MRFLRGSVPFVSAFVLSTAIGLPCRAQCLSWQDGYSAAGVDNLVFAFATFDDGSGPALYAGGRFANAGGAPASHVARWDGHAWSPLGSGVDGEVYALAAFDDGSGPALYVAGYFTTAGGGSASNLARWNGSSWSDVGGGMNGSATALCVFDDGSGPALYVGGWFSSAGGVSATHIAKWNGSAWSSVGGGLDLTAFAMLVFDDGSGPALVVGGDFTTAGGAPANRIAKWNGSQWSAYGPGFDDIVEALAIYDAGSGPTIVAAGNFIQSGSQVLNRVASWDGSGWNAFGTGLNKEVRALRTFDDGSGTALYAGGQFYPPSRIVRWRGGGWEALDTSFLFSEVDALSAFDSGHGVQLVAGGGRGYGCVGTWDGAQWASLAEGPFGGQLSYGTFDDGSGPALYIAGTFTSVGSIHANGIAKRSGEGWAAVGGGITGSSEYFPGVKALQVYDDGSGPALYAGGGFATAGGMPANNIARWDGASWSALGSGITGYNFGLFVSSMAVFDDGSGPALYVAGNFLFAGGITVNNIARWNGTSWSAVGSGAGTTGPSVFVGALAVFDDGTGPALYAGGGFTTIDGVTVNYIAKWNGSVWSPVGTGMDNGVLALQVFDDGSGPALYAGGAFTTAGGTSVKRIAKWDGTTWSALDLTMNFDVHALAVFDDGTGLGPALYAGGGYSYAGSSSVHYLATWNGHAWTQIADPSFDGRIEHLGVGILDPAPGAGPSLLASGQFLHAGSRSSAGIAEWKGCGRPGVAFCFGDGTGAACPCANYGVGRRGCQNSAGTGGALLSTAGSISLAHDSLVLTSSFELPSVLSIFLQGSAETGPFLFGDGLRCAGGTLKRMYAKSASGGVVAAPQGSELSISHRSAQMGSPIAPLTDRIYQVYYRDPNLAFCPNPPGNGWNVSNAIRIQWLP
jgi:hypothetical protein